MQVSIFKRNITFWIRYSVNGKQYRESLQTKNPTAAKRIASEIEKNLVLGIHRIPSDKTHFEPFFEKYLDYATSHKRYKTIRNDQWAVTEFLKRTKIKTLQDVSPDIIESFKKELSNNGYSPSSINIQLRHLSSILVWR